MKFVMENDDVTRTIRFSGELSVSEIERLDLRSLDRALLRDVDRDSAATAADHLLVLEMLYRRSAERASNDPQRVTGESA